MSEKETGKMRGGRRRRAEQSSRKIARVSRTTKGAKGPKKNDQRKRQSRSTADGGGGSRTEKPFQLKNSGSPSALLGGSPKEKMNAGDQILQVVFSLGRLR